MQITSIISIMQFKLGGTVLVLVAFHACLSYGFKDVLPRGINEKPTQIIANVSVIDTPLYVAHHPPSHISNSHY